MAQLSPAELVEFTNLVLAINAELPSPPHAAYAYAASALCATAPVVRRPSSQSAKIGRIGRSLGLSGETEEKTGLVSILDGDDPDTRNAIELQTLVLCTLLEKDAAEDLIEIALERLGGLSEGLDESGRELVRIVRERRSRQ